MSDDPVSSAYAIQSAFYRKFETTFFVSCAPNAEDKTSRLVAHGDGYCIAQNNNVTCQVVSLSA